MDVSEEEWEESASAGVDVDQGMKGRLGMPGGCQVGEGRWLNNILGKLASEELGEVDFRILEEEVWQQILTGKGVLDKLKAEVLAIMLEEEGYEVDAEGEKALRVATGVVAAECWKAQNGAEAWVTECKLH